MPVHPSQLYSVVNALLLSLLLSALLARRKRHGIVLPWLFILYSISRSTLEMVRVDNPLDTAGLTISQAISVCAIVLAILWLRVLVRCRHAWLVAFLLTMLYAFSDEFHQTFVPGRYADPWDLFFDALGALLALALWLYWRRR